MININKLNILNMIKILKAVILVVMGVLIAALPVMLLWNWLMPDIFGLMELNFLQALGLSLLSSLLFRPYGSNSSN